MRRALNGTFGFYASELHNTPLLSKTEEIELAARIQKGDREARDHLIRANLRLVIELAGHYFRRGFAGSIPLQDLVEEGNLGLIRASEDFDPSKHKARFSTYASYWIKQTIRSFIIDQGAVMHLPAYTITLVHKWQVAVAQLTADFDRAIRNQAIGKMRTAILVGQEDRHG